MADQLVKDRIGEILKTLPAEEISPETRRKVLNSLDELRASEWPAGAGSRTLLLAAAALFLFVLIASAVFLPMLWPYRDRIMDHPRDRSMVMDTVSSERG